MNSTSFDQFKASLRGGLIQPSDEGYDAARKVYNGMIDKRPQLIARCSDVADIISAVNYARENKLLLAVRGGGHNGAGLGICDGGLVIDLSRRRGVRVNPKTRTVQVESGCTWGDVDHATHPFGLAVPTGIVSTTGVAGLTLGGRHGYLARKFGLTIDNLLEADLVLADGSFITVNGKENEALYWAIRGGGGNFGVVTSFTFRGNPVSTVYAGPMMWDFDKAAEVMKWYREFIMKAPEDMYGWLGLFKVPAGPPFPEHLHGKTVCGIVWCYTGPMDEAEKAFKPVRQMGPPVLDFVGPMPLPMLNSMFDALFPSGLQWYWKGDFVNELSDEAIKLHLKYCSELPSALSTMHLYLIDGAVHRVGKSNTPFSYRKSMWSMVIAGIDSNPANKDRITTWAKQYWEALHPYSAGGAYVNFMMEEGQSRVESTYGDNYKRLSEIKRKYDPTNLFRVNQNIKPSS
jgi:UDP-N-acetylenolpyruvoylglucosamine reductase